MVRRRSVGILAVLTVVLAMFAAVSLAQRPGNPPLLDKPSSSVGRSISKSADPMADVDTFLDRNRKEADTAIQALSEEAESLRARLQKVETALARWQSVAGALNQQAGAMSIPDPMPPVGKVRWKQPEPKAVPPPTLELPPPSVGNRRSVPPPGDEPPVLPDPGAENLPAEPNLTPIPAPNTSPDPVVLPKSETST